MCIRDRVSPADDVPADAGGDRLATLAAGFTEHRYDLRWLVRTIARSRAYRLSSELPAGEDRDARERAWAVFPLSPLRPEQLVGALLQASSVRTVDLDSHLVARFLRLLRVNQFVEEYGDAVGDELAGTAGTVPQALLRMNGKLPQEMVDAQPFSAVGRIAMFATSDRAALDTLYLSFLSRRPSAPEVRSLLPAFSGTSREDRGASAEDVAWALFNSPELSWNH